MARISLVALRTLGTSSARQPGRSSGARRPRDAVVAVRSWIAFRARAVVDVARPVVVHILGREVAPAVLVQIPAVVAIATGVACGTLRAVVTLRTLRSRRAVAPRRSIRSRRARHPVVTRVALGSLSTLGTFAIQDRAGSVVIQILGSQITLAIFVYIPAVEAVRAHRTLRTGHARVTLRTLRPVVARVALRALSTRHTRVALRTLGTRFARNTLQTLRTLGPNRTLGTDAIQDSARSVTIHIFGRQVALVIAICIPAIESLVTLRTLSTRQTRLALRTLTATIARVALRTRRTGQTRITLRTRSARQTRVALGTLGTRFARNTLRTLRSLGARRTDAIQSSARSVAIHIFGSQVTFVIAVGVPAI